MSYQWDVFISYRRADPVENWVHRILHPEVQRWLPHNGGVATPRVFLDTSTAAIPPGSQWPDELRVAVAATRVLLAVLSPDYFESPWCVMELTMMLERANATGVPVVYALQFSDGESYPSEYKSLAYRQFEKFNKYRRPSTVPLSFITAVQALCKDLGDRWRAAPPFDPSWATAKPIASPIEKVLSLPRFGDG